MLSHKQLFMYFPMKKILFATTLWTAAVLTPAFAQHYGHAHGQHATHGQHNPYAGMQDREIKALSEQQMQGLRSGKGMAMAMPAELNGYPGPLHTLELASQLGLTSEQEAQTNQLFAQMQQEAKAQGEKVIEAERELNALFAQKQATPESVSAAVSTAASAQGKLRETHLRYHLSMMQVLSAEQVAAYNKLRGY